jgi:hypothetical protein
MKIGWYPIRKYSAAVESLAKSSGSKHITCVRTEKEADQNDIIISFGNTPVHPKPHQTWLHMDGAYLGRPSYLRITKNAFQPFRYIMDVDRPSDRWNELNTEIKPWRKSGDNILICNVSDRNERFLGFSKKHDIQRLLHIIPTQTSKNITVREKSQKWKRPFSKALLNAFCVITWASTVSVEALINGVPVFIMTESSCTPVSGDIYNLRKPNYPENREQWLYNLAYCQWNRSEINNGLAWEYLMELP